MIWLLACAPPEVTGTLTDALSDAPLTAHLVATPVKGACPSLEVDVVDGAFTLVEPCLKDYVITLDDPLRTLLLEPVRPKSPLALVAWPVPATEGAFLVEGGAAIPLVGVSRVRTHTLGGVPVAYPDVLPEEWLVVDPGDWLVVGGASLAEIAPRVRPLAPSTEARWPLLGASLESPVARSAEANGRALWALPNDNVPRDVAIDLDGRLAWARFSAGAAAP